MPESSANTRLEAFSDGVFAIALTLLIIEIRPPALETIKSTSDLWHALAHMKAEFFAFFLSFGIILITWVSHHGAIKMVRRSCASFIYANGLLLLSVVLVPFPTALLGQFLGTEYAGPAVVLYNAVIVLQAIAWSLVSTAALNNKLVDTEADAATLRTNRTNGFIAIGVYSLIAIGALWFPKPAAIVTTASWTYWLFMGIRMKHA
jgi:uncharacterized membrane protein